MRRQVSKYIAVSKNTLFVPQQRIILPPVWEWFAGGKSRAQAGEADAKVIVVSARRFGVWTLYPLYTIFFPDGKKARNGLRYQREYPFSHADFPPFLYLSIFSAHRRCIAARWNTTSTPARASMSNTLEITRSPEKILPRKYRNNFQIHSSKNSLSKSR